MVQHLIILLSKAFKCQFLHKSNIVYSFLIYVISEYNHLNFFSRQKVAYKSPYLPYSSSSSRLFATFSVVFVCWGIRSYLLDLKSKHENASNIYNYIAPERNLYRKFWIDRQQSYCSIHTKNYILLVTYSAQKLAHGF